MSRRIVVKIGTNVITRPADGSIDITRMSEIVDQVAAAHEAGIEVIMVSSGSIACGRSILPHTREPLDSLDQRQLYSAVGQAKLIDLYFTLLKEYGITVGQILTTKESMATGDGLSYQRNCMSVMLRNGVIPIINENDTIAITELMFTDNDELAGLVAEMMNADTLLLLTNVDGIYAAGPDGKLDPSRLIRQVSGGDDVERHVQRQKSSRGRGGMLSKESIAARAAAAGIDTYIACGRRAGIITALLHEPESVPATHFIPKEKRK